MIRGLVATMKEALKNARKMPKLNGRCRWC